MTQKTSLSQPWPNFTQEEADAVSRVLLSNKVNYWTGQEGREFEKEFAVFAGSEYAIALANGTLALDLALQGLSIGAHYGGSASDEVIVTSRTFLASVSTIVNAGARPVFADVDRFSQNISAPSVDAEITENTRAVICVHLAGWPVDIDGIRDVVAGRDIKIIEDCAQAHGALYKGKPVGGLGDVSAWSFCQDKIMTTGGEGGMVTCNDPDLWKKMWAFKDHGKSWDAVYNTEHAPGFRWLHESFGTNWRLTEMQSAIGRIQLNKMSEWHSQRNENAIKLISLLKPFEEILRIPTLDEAKSAHAYYKFYAFVRSEKMRNDQTRDTLIEELNAQGLWCMQGTCSEVYLEKAFNGTGFAPKQRLPVARELGETSLMFQVHPGVTYPHELGC
jgi:dTDP-4-amino-4,6-dideoxygalactose transaminase